MIDNSFTLAFGSGHGGSPRVVLRSTSFSSSLILPLRITFIIEELRASLKTFGSLNFLDEE